MDSFPKLLSLLCINLLFFYLELYTFSKISKLSPLIFESNSKVLRALDGAGGMRISLSSCVHVLFRFLHLD